MTGSYCSIVGCSNNSGNTDQIGFFRVPSVLTREGIETEELTKKRRAAWIRAINRKNFSDDFIGKKVWIKVCGEHFVKGKPAYTHDSKNPDWVPTLKLGYSTDSSASCQVGQPLDSPYNNTTMKKSRNRKILATASDPDQENPESLDSSNRCTAVKKPRNRKKLATEYQDPPGTLEKASDFSLATLSSDKMDSDSDCEDSSSEPVSISHGVGKVLTKSITKTTIIATSSATESVGGLIMSAESSEEEPQDLSGRVEAVPVPDSMDLDKDCKLNDVKLEEIYKRLQPDQRLYVKARFNSLAQFEEVLRQHSGKIGCIYVKTRSYKLKSDSPHLDTIKYSEVVYSCMHGPLRNPLKNAVKRTVKVGCPGFIRLVADEKAGGCQLRISSLRLDHSNHPVGPEPQNQSGCFEAVPETMNLDRDSKPTNVELEELSTQIKVEPDIAQEHEESDGEKWELSGVESKHKDKTKAGCFSPPEKNQNLQSSNPQSEKGNPNVAMVMRPSVSSSKSYDTFVVNLMDSKQASPAKSVPKLPKEDSRRDTAVKPVMLVKAADIQALQHGNTSNATRADASFTKVGPFDQAFVQNSKLTDSENAKGKGAGDKSDDTKSDSLCFGENVPDRSLLSPSSSGVNTGHKGETLKQMESSANPPFSLSFISQIIPTSAAANNGPGEKTIAVIQPALAVNVGETNRILDLTKPSPVVSKPKKKKPEPKADNTGKLWHMCYPCPICDKIFKNSQALSEHRILDHLFQCDICDMKFSKELDMVQHKENTHHPWDQPKSEAKLCKVYTCKVCLKEFKKYHQLCTHMSDHEELRSFFCEVCGRGYAFISQLNQHVVSHSLEKKHQCEVCGKAFKYLTVFKKHQNRHKGIKPFTCEICGKKLASRDGYVSHVLAHKGPPPFKCDLCDKGYYTTGNLKNHKKDKHNVS